MISVLWIVFAMAAVLLACILLAAGLAWTVGEVTSRVQQRRSRPDFRERKRAGRGRSE